MTPDWLKQLAPEHAPPAAGFWPPAPGWWALALVCIALLTAVAWWWLDPHRRRRRAALHELGRIKASATDGPTTARAIQNLLRRYALAVFGAERVARLSGESWLRFVGAEGGTLLAGEVGRSMLLAAFGTHASDERDRWIAAAEAFVRKASPARRALR